ncbi:hypothetical protein SAMN05443667_10620 [Flavobacterium gillisiae]|uniref:Uncharacterized protein n=1 Tax=Flavobacterium gillisiae TaxID=150146 RepID=A0A1H4CG03_9FLAO|nr:hypothetical protein SAMN05443667_10620 [Flavobacterium gillisiae]
MISELIIHKETTKRPNLTYIISSIYYIIYVKDLTIYTT